MAFGFYTGGNAGVADGTLVSSGNKITLTALSPTYTTIYMRTAADFYSSNLVVTIPQYVEMSFDGGTSWKGQADSPYSYTSDVADLNAAVRVRQTSAAGSSTVTISTTATETACTALGQVAGLTALPSQGGNVLSWTALSNRTYYKIERATNSGFSTGLTTLSSTATATTYTDATAANGTAYWYRVTGVGTGRYSDGTASASATLTTGYDGFNDSSFNTGFFTAATSGSGTSVVETSSLAVTDTATANSYACVYLKNAISLATAATYRYRVKNTAGTDGNALLTLHNDGASWSAGAIAKWAVVMAHRPGANTASLYYTDASNAFASMPGQTNLASMSTSNYYDYILEVAQNAGTWQVRATIKDNAATVLSQSSWVNVSNLTTANGSSYWLILGRALDNESFDSSLTGVEFAIT